MSEKIIGAAVISTVGNLYAVAPPVRGWQDVSTAPTDTVVLVEMPNGAVYTGYKRYFSPEQKPEPFRCARTDEIIGWVSRWCAVPERSAPS